MKFLWLTVISTALLTAACASVDESQIVSTGERYDAAYASQPYRLGAGDVLRIQVYGDANITELYTIGADGAIDLPLIGKVPAVGRTVDEVGSEAARRFGDGFLKAPHVTVQVSKYRPIYVLGEVGTPGQYDFVPGMTAQSAIATAKGYSPRANKRVLFIKGEDAGTEQVFEVSPALQVRPGDTIRVGERYF